MNDVDVAQTRAPARATNTHVRTKEAPSHSYLTLRVLRWVYYDRLSGGEGIKLLSRHQRQSNV